MHKTALYYQRLFAFCILLKCKQKNSVIFINDNRRKQASKLGLSLTSFNKYLNRAIEEGLLIKSGKNYQLLTWHEIAKKLSLMNRTYGFYAVLLRQKIRTMNFHQLTVWVRESLVFYKLQQQDFKIKKQLKTLDAVGEHLNVHSKRRGTFFKFNKFRNEANSIGLTTDVHYACVRDNQRTEIVTGCNHLSTLFGNSRSTMNKALNGLTKRNLISRKIIKVEYKGISHSNFDRLKRSCNGLGLYPNYSKDCFVVTLGSVINILLPSVIIDAKCST